MRQVNIEVNVMIGLHGSTITQFMARNCDSNAYIFKNTTYVHIHGLFAIYYEN
jgi:hypothetical protein